MAKYYFLLTFLPALSLEANPELELEDLKRLLAENISSREQAKIFDLLLLQDLLNIKSIWMNIPIEQTGNFSEKELQEALQVHGILPEYMYDFLDKYGSNEERVRFFSELLYNFFSQSREGFLQEYFYFERELRLILAALRAKEAQIDIQKELQFESADEPLIALILSQKEMPSFEPPHEWEWVKEIYQENKQEPLQLHKALAEARFRWLDEKEKEEIFSIDAVLIYLAKLYLVESWHRLSEQLGKSIMEKIG